MAMVNKTSVSHFKVKNTLLKHTDRKGNFKRMLSFLQVDKGRLFFLKLFFEEFKIQHGRSERLACFETPPSSEVFEEFSCTFCTLQSRKLRICEYYILDVLYILRSAWAPRFEICVEKFLPCAQPILLAWTDRRAKFVSRELLLRINLWAFE